MPVCELMFKSFYISELILGFVSKYLKLKIHIYVYIHTNSVEKKIEHFCQSLEYVLVIHEYPCSAFSSCQKFGSLHQ